MKGRAVGLFKNFKESMDDAGALTERAAQSPGGLEAAQAAAPPPARPRPGSNPRG